MYTQFRYNKIRTLNEEVVTLVDKLENGLVDKEQAYQEFKNYIKMMSKAFREIVGKKSAYNIPQADIERRRENMRKNRQNKNK